MFEAFLARASIVPSPLSDTAEPIASTSANEAPAAHLGPNEVAAMPTPSSFSSATERQNFLERKLEAAKALNVPVSNLTVKVIDHWFDMGWFALFKKRFQEDPKTGLPTPRFAADREGDDDAEGEEVQDDPDHAAPGLQDDGTLAEARRRHLDPTSSLIPPPFPNPLIIPRIAHSSHRPLRGTTPPATITAGRSSTQPQTQMSQGSSHHSYSSHSSPQLPYGNPSHAPVQFFSSPTAAAEYHAQQQQQQQLHFQMQTAQNLTHLTNMTQTLLGTCDTLVELLRSQAEDIRAQTELLRRREEREESLGRQPVGGGFLEQANARPDTVGSSNKAAAATEVLANPRVTDDVKHAAAEYLKRLFQ